MSLITKLKEITDKIRTEKPLILNLTNSVTQEFVANSLLAIGAAPIMSDSVEELPELLKLSHAVYINIGTLNKHFINKINCVNEHLESLRSENKPLIFDPVGAGATKLRTMLSKQLMRSATVVRGNASEIMSLGSAKYKTLGVESLNSSIDAKATAVELAESNNNVIVVSGVVDLIISKQQTAEFNFGNSLMQTVTGMGCALTAIIGAFCAVESNYFLASQLAVLYFTLCGESAAKIATAPASFKVAFIDMLYAPDWQYITYSTC